MNDKPTIVVGDLHGMYHVVDRVLERDQPVVFVGDYLDSYTQTVGNQLITLRKVLNAVDSGQAVALLGNHELSYMHPHMRCSGYKQSTDDALLSDYKEGMTFLQAMELMLKPYVWREGFLISHAGVSQALLDAIGKSLEEYLADGKLMDIGRFRGGPAIVGGLHWCDWNHEFEPVEGVPQIVGHTHNIRDEIQVKGNSYCIDCLPYNIDMAQPAYMRDNVQFTVVEIKDGELTELKLELE